MAKLSKKSYEKGYQTMEKEKAKELIATLSVEQKETLLHFLRQLKEDRINCVQLSIPE